MVFDSTTHVDEVRVAVACFVNSDFQIQQDLVQPKLLPKSLNNQELAHVLISALSTKLGVEANDLVAAMLDRSFVNNVPMKVLYVVYPKDLDVGCFSHTLNHTGNNFKTPVLDAFIRRWVGLFSRSH